MRNNNHEKINTCSFEGSVMNRTVRRADRHAASILAILAGVLACVGFPISMAAQIPTTCTGYQAWTVQAGPRSDITESFNHAYPEANATYWGTQLTLSTGSIVSLRGQYPQARYMSFQLYDGDNVVDSINDVAINPDSGQNSPYRAGVAQGTYTLQIVFGRAPRR